MEASNHPEMILLNLVLQTRKLKEVLQAGVRPDHFGVPQAKEGFQYLLEFTKNPSYEGGLPTIAQFSRKYPWFTVTAVPEGVTPVSIAHDVIELSLQRAVTTKVFDLQHKKFVTPEDVEGAVRELKDLLAKHNIIDPAKAAANMGLMQKWYDEGKEKGVTGIPYPWEALNIATRGIQQHDFILLYGRPKHGKTWTLLKVVDHLLSTLPDGKKIVFVSYEMDLQRLVNRLGCIRARINYGRFNQGELSEDEKGKMDLAILDIERMSRKHGKEIIFAGPAIKATGTRKGFSVMDIEQLIDREKPVICMIDGLVHAVDIRTGKRSREWNVVGNISSDTKQMALASHIPVMATHWASRESEGTAPVETQKDIGYADALGQDADLSLRITKIRTQGGGKELILQPEGAREFELLGFTAGAEFCEDLGYKDSITDIGVLKKKLAKAIEDPMEAATKKSSKGGGGGSGGGKVSVADEARKAHQELTKPGGKKSKADDAPIPPEDVKESIH